jgi:protein gp37
MGAKTNIEWADTTVNPTTGCDGCELWVKGKGGPCYAGNLHEGRLAKSMPDLYAADFSEVRLAPGRMAKVARMADLTGTARPDKPWLDGMPRMIFSGDMGDMLSKAVPFEYLKAELIDVAMSPAGSRHIWMVLTKQARRLAEFHHWLLSPPRNIPWPANVWPGVSVTNRKTLWRVGQLMRLRATTFVSAEPLLEDIADELAKYLSSVGEVEGENGVIYTTPALVIVGGESRQSGHKPRACDLAWIRKIVSRCRDAGAAPFVKQFGSNIVETQLVPYVMGRVVEDTIRLTAKDSHGGDWDEWPEDLKIREMPTVQSAAAGRLF